MVGTYIVSVPYDRDGVDFYGRLAGLKGVAVSRKGVHRRIQVSVNPEKISDLRDLLPGYVRIEPVIEHKIALKRE